MKKKLKEGGKTMALTNSYLTSTKNLESIINSVINAKAPERFTNKFLEDLGYNDYDIADVLGVTDTTVRSTRSRIKKKIRP